MEEFRDIKGYEGLYQISNFGRVKSLERKVPVKNSKDRHHSERYLVNNLNSDGYFLVNLSNGKRLKTYSIHRLVITAFVDPIEGKLLINHIDGVKTNNNVNNLEWCTTKENVLHSFKLGLSKNGESHHYSKLTEKEAVQIKYNFPDLYQHEIAKMFGVSQTAVYRIKNNKSWKHI